MLKQSEIKIHTHVATYFINIWKHTYIFLMSHEKPCKPEDNGIILLNCLGLVRINYSLKVIYAVKISFNVIGM